MTQCDVAALLSNEHPTQYIDFTAKFDQNQDLPKLHEV